VLVIGIYAMVEKPASKAKKEHKTKSAAVLDPAGSGRTPHPFKALD